MKITLELKELVELINNPNKLQEYGLQVLEPVGTIEVARPTPIVAPVVPAVAPVVPAPVVPAVAPVVPAVAPVVPAVAPVVPAAPTFDTLKARVVALTNAGKKAPVIALLGSLGYQKLSDVQDIHFPHIAQGLTNIEQS